MTPAQLDEVWRMLDREQPAVALEDFVIRLRLATRERV
jgi:hypothetical protein